MISLFNGIVFIVIVTIFWLLYPPVFFRPLRLSFWEFWTELISSQKVVTTTTKIRILVLYLNMIILYLRNSNNKLKYSNKFYWVIYNATLVIWISKTKLDDFYHSGFSGYCLYLYFLNVSVDMSASLLQVFLVSKRQSSRGCRFNTDCRWVTIQEYLTLVPGYG